MAFDHLNDYQLQDRVEAAIIELAVEIDRIDDKELTEKYTEFGHLLAEYVIRLKKSGK